MASLELPDSLVAGAGKARTQRLLDLGLVLAIGAVTVRALLARLPGMNPVSLWSDDVVYAALTRASDLGSMVSVPTHAPPGFFVGLWAMRSLFGDPEWSLQLLPFLCGLAAIPVMGLLGWRLTGDRGMALLAAALTALNPLLAHYSIYVKPYSLEFLITALLLLLAAGLFQQEGPDPRRFGRLALFGAASIPFSVTSVFASFPVVHLGALRAARSWGSDRPRVLRILSYAIAYDLAVLAAYLLLRSRANPLVLRDFKRGFLPERSVAAAWDYAASKGQHLLEISLPSWRPTDLWDPATIAANLPLVGIGLVWLMWRRPTRPFGALCLAFYSGLLLAAALRLFPLAVGRTSIYAFPVAISLFVAGAHALTSWPRGKPWAGLALGLSVAGFAVARPLEPRYWDVDDAQIVRLLESSATPQDGIVLSPSGRALAAHYGSWPVEISQSVRSSNAVDAWIDRDLTAHLQPATGPKRVLDELFDRAQPDRVWYLAYRTSDEERTLELLGNRGYACGPGGRTRKTTLHLCRHVDPASGEP